MAVTIRRLGPGDEAEAIFLPDDHEPPLGHELQFDLDRSEGHETLHNPRVPRRPSAPTALGVNSPATLDLRLRRNSRA